MQGRSAAGTSVLTRLFALDGKAFLALNGRVVCNPNDYFNAGKFLNCLFMKSLFLSVIAVFALATVSQADVTVKISNVHLCCGKCVKGAEKAVGTVDGAKANIDKDARTIEVTAPDTATAQKVADALVKAGFFGESGDSSIKIDASTGAKGTKVQSLTIKGVHLCCPKCVKAVHETVTAVPGVTGETAQKDAESFTVTGDFNDADVMTALQKAGLTGKVGE
jgi:periplasmic mercuric ion binding protein